MSEENNLKEAIEKDPERQPEATRPAPVKDPPRVVKEAEHKLKEMSREAKERKTGQVSAKQPKVKNDTIYL